MATKKTKRGLKKYEAALNNAASYQEWAEAARAYDTAAGLDEWRDDEDSEDFDAVLIRERLDELKRLRNTKDVTQLVFALHEGLHGNLGNMANPALYTHTRFGTKNLLTRYINEVADALNYLCDNEFDAFDFGAKLKFFKRTGMSFGRSALMLSGGATLGMFHIGVLSALWREGLLPRVISGSSAGSIIAGVAGTHDDEELGQIFDPEYLKLQAWKSLGVKGAISGRSIMSSEQLKQCLSDNVGELTFEEAFEKTGRIINIPVTPTEKHQHARLLNYLASPSVLVPQASLASCAIPGVFPSVTLTARNYKGEVSEYMPNHKWMDGSLFSDLPMLRLSRFHNVNHYIVSQTNPHVVPFLDRRKAERRGLAPLARDLVTQSSKQALALARHHLGSEGVIAKAHQLANQKYKGDINIFPKGYTPKKLMSMLSNPTKEDIALYIEEGERHTWPQIERIRNATLISRTFEACLQRLKEQQYGARRKDALIPMMAEAAKRVRRAN